jgi:hypothetical protein
VPPAANPNHLGVVGGDTAGFPNGRRLADDVFDIELKGVAGAAYPLFHPAFKPDPLAAQLGDGVDANDVPFRAAFPYVALAHEGTVNYPFNSQTGGGAQAAGGGQPGMPRTGATDSSHLADFYIPLLTLASLLGAFAVIGGWAVRRRAGRGADR